MNKKLLAVAVGGALSFGAAASAVAAPTVYGRAIAYLQNCSACTSTTGQLDETWNMEFGGSRLGVKGDEDLGGGLKAIYTIEFGVALDGTTQTVGVKESDFGADLNGDGDATDTITIDTGASAFDPGNRPKWVGLEGGFGKVKLGRQFHPQWDYVASTTDIFTEGTIRNQLGARASDMLYYNSPKIGGMFDFGVAAIFGGGRDDEQLDETQIGVRVAVGPVTIGAVNTAVKSSGGSAVTFGDKMGAAVVFKTGPFMAQAAFENQEVSATAEQEALIFGGSYTMGNHVFLAQYAMQERDNSVPEPTTLKAEYVNMLSKATRVWVAAINNDSDVATTDDELQLQLGVRTDF